MINNKLLNTITNLEAEKTKLKTKLKSPNLKQKEKEKLADQVFLLKEKLLSSYVELNPCPFEKTQEETAETNECECEACLFSTDCECKEKCWHFDFGQDKDWDDEYTIDEQIEKWKNNEHSISELCDYCETRKEHNLKRICDCEDCEFRREDEDDE